MTLRKPLAAALSLLIAGGPASAASQRTSPIVGVSVGQGAPLTTGVSLPNVQLGASLPQLGSLPLADRLPSLPSAVVPSAVAPSAQAQPGKLQAANPNQPAQNAAQSSSPLASVTQTAQDVERRPEQAPAAISNLYDGKVGAPVPTLAVSGGESEKQSRLARFIKKPAVKTAASLAAAASPLAILALRAKEAVPALYSNMDPEFLIHGAQTPASGAVIGAAAALAAVFGAAAGSAIGRDLGHKLFDKRSSRTAMTAFATLVVAGTAAVAAAALTLLSPVAAAVILSGAIAVAAAQNDLIAPYTRWREARARKTGIFDIVEKNGDTFLDLKEDQLGKLHMLSGAIERGLGEKNLATNTQWDFEFAFYFRRSGDRIELVRKNTLFRAAEGSPVHKTISRGVPDSVIASAELQELDGRLRVDASKLFVADFFGFGSEVDWGYGGDYTLDEKLSGLLGVSLFPKNAELKSRLTFLRGNSDYEPSHLSDTRRVDLDVRYSLSALPDGGYAPRKANPLLGHFTTTFEDWSDDQRPDLVRQYIQRWRLEKSDPTQEKSQVKQPVTFWVDETIPKEYRAAVARGVLAWNKAFERIGLLGALQVKFVGDDEGFDPADIRHNMISYRFERDSPFALGNSRANPLTGEIYHAHVTIVPEHARSALQLRFKEVDTLSVDPSEGKKAKADSKTHKHDRRCRHAEAIARDASLTLAVLQARGELTEARKAQMIEQYMEELVLHEIGHTLGLRHNFVAKTWLSLEKAQEGPLFSASVMDYTPMNLASRDEKQGALFQLDIGPYDYLAIEYAYKDIPPAQEDAELTRLAAKTAEPGLEYATDEDLSGVDPYVVHNSLGDDIVKHAARRAAIARELWDTLEAEAAAGTGDHQDAYRKWIQAWLSYDIGVKHVAGLIGGVRFRRTHRGEPKGRRPYEPISADEQKRALAFLAEKLFADEPFAASPALLSSISKSRVGGVMEAGDAGDLSTFSHEGFVAKLREGVVDMLLDENRLKRLDESANLLSEGQERLTVRAVYDGLIDATFGELASGSRLRKKDSRVISPMRRRLQDKIVSDLVQLMDEDNGWGPEIRVPARAALMALQRRLSNALKSRAWETESRAHLTELARLVKKGLTPNKA